MSYFDIWPGLFILALISAGMVGIALALGRLHKNYYLYQYMFFTRYAWSLALVVCLLPVCCSAIGLAGAREFLGNLFIVSPRELILITVAVVLTSWTIVYSFGLVYMGVPGRCELSFNRPNKFTEGNRVPWFLESVGLYVSGLLLSIPTLLIDVLQSTGAWYSALGSVAVGLVIASTFFTAWFIWGDNLAGAFFKRSSWMARPLGTEIRAKIQKSLFFGYQEPVVQSTPPKKLKTPQFRHENGIAFIAMVLCLYVGIGLLTDPGLHLPLFRYFPAYAFVLVLISLSCLLLNMLAFFLDAFRIPVLIFLLVTSAAMFRLNNTDHEYPLHLPPVPESKDAATLTPRSVMKAWAARHPESKTPAPIFVTASGGGIKAASWTAAILAGLRNDPDIGDQFAESLVLLSTVSGGSVGGLYFLDSYQKGGPPPRDPDPNNPIIFGSASSSSLAAVAWGSAYPDFLRLVLSPLIRRDRDRGWALEERWRDRMTSSKDRLSDWRIGIMEGWRPVQIMNATVVETGDRLTISPIDVAEQRENAQVAVQSRMRTKEVPKRLDFRTLYPGCDLDVATAARLSATFPWVSPVARPPKGATGPRYHVGDGGYFDNEGLVTAMEFLTDILPDLGEKRLRRSAVLIRILASPPPDKVQAGDHDGWENAFMGPLSTMLNVRTASQTARNNEAIERFQELCSCMEVDLHVVTLVLPVAASMSWHLQPAEITAILREWRRATGQEADQVTVELAKAEAEEKAGTDPDRNREKQAILLRTQENARAVAHLKRILISARTGR